FEGGRTGRRERRSRRLEARSSGQPFPVTWRIGFADTREGDTLPIPRFRGARREPSRMGAKMRSLLGLLALAVLVVPGLGGANPGPFRWVDSFKTIEKYSPPNNFNDRSEERRVGKECRSRW